MSEPNLAKDYDHAFFKMHQPWRSDYEAIADILITNLNFKSVVDLGCGNRYILNRMDKFDKHTLGVDGSTSVLAFEKNVRILDLTAPIAIGKFDLVICTEVAEHIKEEYADFVVANVANAAAQTIFFSAAQKGKGGHLHVNEQEPEYWMRKFACHGFALDEVVTDKIVRQLKKRCRHTWWFAANCFVMRRATA